MLELLKNSDNIKVELDWDGEDRVFSKYLEQYFGDYVVTFDLYIHQQGYTIPNTHFEPEEWVMTGEEFHIDDIRVFYNGNDVEVPNGMEEVLEGLIQY